VTARAAILDARLEIGRKQYKPFRAAWTLRPHDPITLPTYVIRHSADNEYPRGYRGALANIMTMA
jgi:hypothetical protein